MPPIPKSLKRWFETAGRPQAERQERERRESEKRRREIALEQERERKARALAPAAAERVGAWLEGLQADGMTG